MVPLWLKIAYTLMVCVIVPFYWREYGPGNFLWFSDIALLVMVPALWLESRLLAGMMALILPLEIMWMVGFFSGGAFLTVADYMFDPALPLWLRALSLFHLPLPAVIVFMLWRLGYDGRALPLQTALTLVVMPLTYLLTAPEENINWVFRPPLGEGDVLSPYLYPALVTLVLIVAVYLPAHFLLRRWFPVKDRV